MATVDDKVVAMSFESSKFEQGVNKTIGSLDKLKNSINNFSGAGKGLEDVNRAAKGVDLSHIGAGVDAVKNRLGALRLVGIGVMANLATQAVAMGSRVVKSFTLDPLVAGFHNYETQINAVQTIVANTGLRGKKGLEQVNGALAELNDYANKTVYNFSEMAKNIGTFTAAGVDLKTATASIKGIANLAALSGSSSEQASTAMYQLSQAIAAGQVHLQDWNSVVNAGMGGKVFQKALANTAQAMGVLKDGSVKLVGPMKQLQINGESFRQALQTKPGQKSWLTSQVLTNTLKQFTGDMSKAQLRAQGFTDAQIKAIQVQGKIAVGAATNIKTFTQLQQALKEEVASAWGSVFKTIFGNLGQATTMFTAVHNVAQNALTNPIMHLNKLLEGWAKLGGRTALINGLKNAFHALGAVMAPIKQAFHDIFPPASAKSLADATKRFEQFTKTLKPSHETVENLRHTFRGLFAVLDIGKQIVGGIFTVLGSLFGVVGKGSGGFLSLTARIGDFLVKVDESLKKGDRLHHFFALLGQIILVPIHALGVLKNAITNATQGMHPAQTAIAGVTKAWDELTGHVQGTGSIFKPIVTSITQVFGQLGQAITDSITHINFDSALNVIEVGLIGGIALMFKKFAQGGFDSAIFSGLFKNIAGSFGGLTFALKGVGGAFAGLNGVLKGLTGNLQAMQEKTKAEALKQIAIAIALIAASAVALSLVDPKKLNSAMSAMAIMFGELLGSMAILDKIAKTGGFIKIPVIAASMIALAVAVDLLTLAVLGLSRLSWSQLSKGLVGVGVILGAVSVAAKPLGANSAGLIRAGVGISAIGVALNILALAVRQFGSMDISTLGKGLGAVAAALASIGLASRLFPTGMVQMGIGLGIVAGALLLLSKSIEKFGNMNWTVMGKGILGVAGALAALGIAMRVMPKGMIAQAVAIGIVSLALQEISKAVSSFGGMSLEQIAKGLGVLAGALAILAIGLMAMEGGLVGAGSLAIAAASIALLTPAIEHLGKMSWTQIIKSMVALAAALTVLGVASIILAPAAPALLALGASLLLIGGGLALAGAGIALIGIGLAAIAVAGPVSVGILVKALEALSKSIPDIAVNLVNGLLSIVQKIAKVAPQFVAAIIKIVEAMVNAIPVLAPKLGQALITILIAALKVLNQAFPRLVEAGFQMLMSLLKGIRNHITEVTNMTVDIVTRFVRAIANKIPQLIGAGAQILVGLLRGIAQNIGKIATAAADIIVSFVKGIGNNLARIATAGASTISKFINAVANGYGKIITAGTNLIVKLVVGIGNAATRIGTAALNVVTHFISTMAREIPKRANQIATSVIGMINAMAGIVRKREPEFINALFNVGVAIVQGLIDGIASMAGHLAHAVEKLVTDHIPGPIRKVLHISSPSRLMFHIGKNVVGGLIKGIASSAPDVSGAVTFLEGSTISAFSSSADRQSRVLVKIGQQINQGFVQGLAGSPDDIKSAFNNLKQQVNQQISNLDQQIATEEDRRKKLQAAKKPDKQAIEDLTASIRQQKHDLDLLTAAHKELSSKALTQEKAQLVDLSSQYDKMKQKVDDATTSLKNAIQARDDFAAQTTTNFSALPDIVGTDADGNPIDPAKQVQNYGDSLNASADQVVNFANDLATLQSMGIDKTTYQHLLDIGPAAEDFIHALIALGPNAVDQINTLDLKLQGAAGTIGTNAGTVLYQAGVDTAQKLVDGLTNGFGPDDKGSLNALKKSIDSLVATIVHQVKHKLGIKSPSEVFAEIGRLTGRGMAKGLDDSTKVVTDAVYGVSDSAIAAIKDGMSGVGDMVAAHIDPNPTITPVLDLSQVQSGADAMSSIFANVAPITSADQANAIAAMSGSAGAPNAPGQSIIKFEQNNYSPESLSDIDIYRQTKNQLAQARPVLAS